MCSACACVLGVHGYGRTIDTKHIYANIYEGPGFVTRRDHCTDCREPH